MGEHLYQILGRHRAPDLPDRKPSWLKVRAPGSPEYLETRKIVKDLKLHTVCEEASCPNIGECFGKGTATFMILGDLCTRRCPFCDVGHGKPLPPDADEGSWFAAEKSATLEVPCVDLATLMRRNGDNHIDLLKLDIEGAEYGVLDDLLRRRLPNWRLRHYTQSGIYRPG